MLQGSALITGRARLLPEGKPPTVLRNDLVNLLAEKDNDTVTVDVNGIPVDIKAVTTAEGCIVLRLDPDGLGHALDWAASQAPKADPS